MKHLKMTKDGYLKKRFLLLPMKLDGEVKWLTWAIIKYQKMIYTVKDKRFGLITKSKFIPVKFEK